MNDIRIKVTAPGTSHQLARPSVHAAAAPSWVTTVLRPAGRLDRGAARRLRPLLVALALVPGLLVVDLTAAAPVSAEGWRVLSNASSNLDAVGGGLLVTGVAADAVPAGTSGITLLPGRREVTTGHPSVA
jgi:anti-anti-sigma regulatory factor